MKSKIEKLNQNLSTVQDRQKELYMKVDQIIDYLNSQDQEEKKTLEQIRGEFDKERIKEWDKTAMETYKQATQDTPEEWEKEFKFSYGHLYIQNEDGEFCKINGETEDMIDFIKQLLENREKEVVEKMYRKQNTFLHIGDFERWLEKEYPKLKDIDLDDDC